MEPTKSVLGRTRSASWSRDMKKRIEELRDRDTPLRDELVGQCEPVFGKKPKERP